MIPNDLDKLRVFYAENRQQLFTYAISITGQRESAEDAIHYAFQQIMRRDHMVSDLRPYIFRCVRNASVDALRRAKVQGDALSLVTGDEYETGPWLNAGLTDELRATLGKLSPDEREVIVLKIYDDFTFQEIAELREVPLPTVASWYRRGLDKLRTLLKKAQ